MILDFDIETGLPPWELSIIRGGVKIEVRMPTALEMARLIDLKSGSSEACCIGQRDLFCALTGVDVADAAGVDAEEFRSFFEALGELVEKRLSFKYERRKEQRFVSKSPTSGAPQRLN
jgi:hypothetical protein